MMQLEASTSASLLRTLNALNSRWAELLHPRPLHSLHATPRRIRVACRKIVRR